MLHMYSWCTRHPVRVSHRAFLITIQARLVDDSHATSLSAEISVAPAPAPAPVGSLGFLAHSPIVGGEGQVGGVGSSTCVLVRGETFHFRFASRWAKARFSLAIIGYFNKPICCFLLALNANRNWNAANAPTTAATFPSPPLPHHLLLSVCVWNNVRRLNLTQLSSAQLVEYFEKSLAP